MIITCMHSMPPPHSNTPLSQQNLMTTVAGSTETTEEIVLSFSLQSKKREGKKGSFIKLIERDEGLG